MESDKITGAVIRVSGIVQGVGFRPFVYRRAVRLGLKGWVRNTGGGVLIRVDGPRGGIEELYREIRENPPAVAEVHSSAIDFTEPAGFQAFAIAESVRGETAASEAAIAAPERCSTPAGGTCSGRAQAADAPDTAHARFHSPAGASAVLPVSPDIATCGECLAEIADPKNRRFRYAFTNCTNCGPRFTILRSIPYDRPNTTMRSFAMCGPCEAEYGNPVDRRYHAQPNACPMCGPSLRLVYPDGRAADGDPVAESLRLIGEGKILAVKGIGGYHLAADPLDCRAVRLLRERKRRPGKPFALMARDLDAVGRRCVLDDGARALLESPERPILLLPRRERGSRAGDPDGTGPGDCTEGNVPPICPEVAPDTNLLGVMLPYTPLHHLLFGAGTRGEGPELLVMTSGNRSEEPLAYRDEEAFGDLAALADAFLTHDREIRRPCDDSVFMSAGAFAVPIRRSRGCVPRGIDVGFPGRQVLSAGASEKNTFCVVKGGKAFLSHHVGDLNNEKSVDAYLQGIEDFLAMFEVSPEAVACDLHPDYVSTRLAEERAGRLGVPLFRIQHHHAHVASLLGEKGVGTKVIGVAFDGTGYGPDGTIWGGEFLLADGGGYERVGHFRPVPMPGGEKAVLETDRMGISYLLSAFGSLSDVPDIPFLEAVGQERLGLVEKTIRMGMNCPLTSSCGRLFDAVSALLGLCTRPSYDAQGAVLLETAAGDLTELDEPYPFDIGPGGVVCFSGMVREIARELSMGRNIRGGAEPGKTAAIARRFHATIVRAVVDSCQRIREACGIETAALSGGAFQNRILIVHCARELEKRGFTVLVHAQVPPNDGGIALGQSIAALARLEGGVR